MKQALFAYLWTEAVPAPWEYITLVLCRDVYHCRLSELRGENVVEVFKHLNCIDVENNLTKMRGTGDG